MLKIKIIHSGNNKDLLKTLSNIPKTLHYIISLNSRASCEQTSPMKENVIFLKIVNKKKMTAISVKFVLRR